MKIKHNTTLAERVISSVIIIILLIITIIILAKQSNYDLKNFGMISANSSSTSQSINLGNISVKQFIPTNFKLYLKKELYDSDNLHVKINGKATLYTDIGFRKMLSQRYASKNNDKIWFELFIYEMDSARNSFGVYSQQRRSDANIIKTLNMAYSTENAVFMSIGNYYVEILGSFQSNMMNKAMLETAQKIDSFFSSSDIQNIHELSFFDKKRIVPGSENLYPADAFGYHGLHDIFTAKYKLKNKETTVYISKKENIEGAQKEAQNYAKFLLENGGTRVKTSLKDIILIDLFGSYETILTHNRFLFGVHGAENKEISEKISIEILNKIKKDNP